MPKPQKTAEEIFEEERIQLGLQKRTEKLKVTIKEKDVNPRKQIAELNHLHQEDLDQVVYENHELAQMAHDTGDFGKDTIEPVEFKKKDDGKKTVSSMTKTNRTNRETLMTFLQK